MTKPFTLSITLLILISTSGFSQWTQKADLTGGKRYEAVGFSINGKGYIGTGIDLSRKKDFWEYDPSTDTWSQKADFGGTARAGAVGFSIGDKGYIGTGVDNAGDKKDFWEYDPVSNAWLQKADFGGFSRGYAVGFSIGNKGYIGTGNSGGVFKKDFWEYDPVTDTWLQKADFGGLSRFLAVGFSIGNKGYIGTGGGNVLANTDFWEFDPSTNSWLQRANVSGRNAAVGFSIGSKGYIGTGYDGSFKKDFWEYDPAANTWLQKEDLPGLARFSAVGFSIGSKGYIGTGLRGAGTLTDFWEYSACVPNTYYRDADNDTYGDPQNTIESCTQPEGYVSNSLDCNDGNSSVHPGATEICNGVDDNCNGQIDEGVKTTYYRDADGDGYGNATVTTQACSLPTGYVSNNSDCNDANSNIHPGAPEVCNGVDDDCDGQIDDGVKTTYYQDADGDGYGNIAITTQACTAPSGYVSNNTDCNDANSNIHPGATEVCNGVDDNCNGIVDEQGGSVSAGADRTLYFGYLPEQCISITANVTDGIQPYSYQWTLDRPLLYNVITADGDESMSGVNSQTVTICLLDTATLCITVTDANGCTFTDCVTIFASDVRCIAGNSNNAKVTVCHNGNMICVDENAVAAHLAHGDYVGPCVANRANVGAVEIEQNLKPGFNIYPNPNKGDLVVTMSLTSDEIKDAVIHVVNVNGQIVKQIKVNNQHKLNFSIKETGIYFIKLITNKNVYTRKVTVIR